MGAEWLCDGRAFRIVRQLTASRFVALDQKFHTEQEVSESEILARYAAGELRFATEVPPGPQPIPTAASPVLSELTASEQRLLDARWQAIEPLTQHGRSPSGDDFERRADELRRQGTPVSPRSLRRYWTAWSEAGGDRRALLSRIAHRGRRGQSRKTGFLSREPVLRKLADEAIQSVYLTTARRPISAVVRRVLEDLERRNSRLPAAQAVPIPRTSALSRAIARRIERLDPWEVDRARWGRRIADQRHQPKSRQRLATRILERVEIDHSPLKVVVGTEAGPIGQPWLTVLIDYYSRMILGFCLGFEPPSYGVIREALRQAILPKTGLKARYPRLQGDWPCYGIPEKLVCDRGSDFTSKDLEAAAFQLGFDLDFNPPRTPHFKGTVESFFDVLNDQLLSSLPGRTFRSWERRADHNADDGPLLPYEALLEIIHLHLVDGYAASPHPTAGKTRREMWVESAAEFPPCLPASPEDLIVLLARRVERSLSARGIELGGMFYTSDELLALRADLPAHNLSVDRLQVRYNPWDLGEAWVLNPISRRFIRAPAVDPAMKGLTEYQWRVLKKAVRDRFEAPDEIASLAAGRNAIRDVVESEVRKPSRKRRVRAARFLQQTPPHNPGEAVLSEDAWIDVDRAGAMSLAHDCAPQTDSASPPDPLDAAPKSVSSMTPSVPVTDPELSELDVDDWDVAC